MKLSRNANNQINACDDTHCIFLLCGLSTGTKTEIYNWNESGLVAEDERCMRRRSN